MYMYQENKHPFLSFTSENIFHQFSKVYNGSKMSQEPVDWQLPLEHFPPTQ